jgi:hypothetical protein
MTVSCVLPPRLIHDPMAYAPPELGEACSMAQQNPSAARVRHKAPIAAKSAIHDEAPV